MSKPVPYLIQGKNIILVIDGKSHTISKDTHMAYGKIVDALKSQDWDSLRDLVEPKKVIIKFGKGNISIDDNVILWKGKPFHNALASRMLDMMNDGFPIEPMAAFMENLMQNPSKRSVDQVYGFLEKNSLPITEDGHFLAFKRVKTTYMDCHTGTIDNSIGQVVEMDRNGVDDNPDSHCSSGLHFCSESYLASFGSPSEPVMILKINPADVVSIPTDYNGAKGRCCKYEVVAEVRGDAKDAFARVVNGDYSPKPAPAKQPAASAPKVATPAHLAGWPFPGQTTPVDTDASYDVVRWSDNDCFIAQSVSLSVAEALVAKNIRQKKAMLVILNKDGDLV